MFGGAPMAGRACCGLELNNLSTPDVNLEENSRTGNVTIAGDTAHDSLTEVVEDTQLSANPQPVCNQI